MIPPGLRLSVNSRQDAALRLQFGWLTVRPRALTADERPDQQIGRAKPRPPPRLPSGIRPFWRGPSGEKGLCTGGTPAVYAERPTGASTSALKPNAVKFFRALWSVNSYQQVVRTSKEEDSADHAGETRRSTWSDGVSSTLHPNHDAVPRRLRRR